MAKSEPKRGAPWEVVGMGPARHVRTVEGKLLVMGPVNASPLDLEHAVRAVNEREDMLAEIDRVWGEIERLTEHLSIANTALGPIERDNERLTAEIERLRAPAPLTEAAPGDIVTFMHRGMLHVGYVDGADVAADVVAIPVDPGRWKERRNPGLEVSCYRSLFEGLTVIQRASRGDIPADVRPEASPAVQAALRGLERVTPPTDHGDGDTCPSCSEALGSPSVCAISHDFRPGAYDGATVTTTPGHTWRRDASGGPTLVPVRPSARPVLDQVYAEGRPAASWVLEQVREAMTAPVDVPHDLREAAMARWAPPPAPVATAEPWAPQVGDRVVTAKRLHPTTVFDGVSVDATNTARRPGAQGRLVRFVDREGLSPACIVAHDDGTEAPYDAAELLPAPEVKS